MTDKPKPAEVYLSQDDALILALKRFTSSRSCPQYLKVAALPYLVKR